jgi:CTD nuclear envelope phosphatase 1
VSEHLIDGKDVHDAAEQDERGEHEYVDEKTPLLSNGTTAPSESELAPQYAWYSPRRITNAILYGVHLIFYTVTAPGRFVLACFYDEHGRFSALMPLRKLASLVSRRKRKQPAQHRNGVEPSSNEKTRHSRKNHTRRSPSVDSISSTGSDPDPEDSPARHTRSRTASLSPESQADSSKPRRKSIRIKVANDEALRQRKASKASSTGRPHSADSDMALVASALKSPSSAGASAKLTRYPRAPATPRPLVPRRQPSYTPAFSSDTPKKTLIIDLDETLIHSMAKGGRMSTGHMVEVRLSYPTSTSANSPPLASGVPILYYVHERPACHEFLRKVAKWYNLIIFTASVQEYADPVIDWLERERKYFSGRYYRQHCTYRNGAYIKDLAMVEPDLSRVAILDNSPMSYIFHEGE